MPDPEIIDVKARPAKRPATIGSRLWWVAAVWIGLVAFAVNRSPDLDWSAFLVFSGPAILYVFLRWIVTGRVGP